MRYQNPVHCNAYPIGAVSIGGSTCSNVTAQPEDADDIHRGGYPNWHHPLSLSAGRADVPAAGLQSESLVVGSPGAAPVPAMAWNTWDAVGLRYWVPGTPGVGASLITRESGGHSGPTGSANSRSGRRDTDRPSGRRDIAFESGVNSGPGITQIHHVAGSVIKAVM